MMVRLGFLLAFSAALSSMSAARVIEDREARLLPRQNRNGNQRFGNNNQNNRNNNNNNQGAGNNANAGQLVLNAANIQTASQSDGQGAVVETGQSRSQTDPANFINFCQGKKLTNGQQVRTGSCNGIVMGEIPAQANMISSIIINPAPGANLPANKAFDIQVKVNNLVAGSFTNPDVTYYAAPQTLQNGKVVGHTHVTVQSLGNSLTPQNAPDASTFVFFKGVNDQGNGQGLLSATVAQGLPAGNYRVCTMTSSSNHQPVLMPVAQRGAQDDCTKFTVGGNGGNNNNVGNANQNQNGGNNGNNNNNNNNNNGGQQGGNKNQGSKTTTSSSKSVKAAAKTSATSRAAGVKATSKTQTTSTKATAKTVATSSKSAKPAAQTSSTPRAVVGNAGSKKKTTSTPKATVAPAVTPTATSSRSSKAISKASVTSRAAQTSLKSKATSTKDTIKPAATSSQAATTSCTLPSATGGVISGDAVGKNTTVAAGRAKPKHAFNAVTGRGAQQQGRNQFGRTGGGGRRFGSRRGGF